MIGVFWTQLDPPEPMSLSRWGGWWRPRPSAAAEWIPHQRDDPSGCRSVKRRDRQYRGRSGSKHQSAGTGSDQSGPSEEREAGGRVEERHEGGRFGGEAWTGWEQNLIMDDNMKSVDRFHCETEPD